MLSIDELNQGIQQLHDEGAGAWELFVLTPKDVPAILDDAVSGDVRSAQVLKGLGDLMAQFLKWDVRRDGFPQCFCCAKDVSPKVVAPAFCLVVSRNDQSRVAMGGVVCAQCARGKRKQVLRRAFAAWRKEVNPSVREIQISSQIGRA